MWKKMLLAGLSALLCAGAYAGERDNAAVGGALGGALGAVIGHDMNGRNGAVVGAAIGGATGAAIGLWPSQQPPGRSARTGAYCLRSSASAAGSVVLRRA